MSDIKVMYYFFFVDFDRQVVWSPAEGAYCTGSCNTFQEDQALC